MSSVHRLKGKPNWICFYTDRNGMRRGKSTMTEDRREAERVCRAVQAVEDKARNGNLTPERARKVIEGTVAEIMAEMGSPIDTRSVRKHFEDYAAGLKLERSAGTFVRYDGVVKQFLAFLKDRANRPLSTLSAGDVDGYRAYLCERVAPRTTNTHLKVLRVALERAVKQGFFDRNPARLVDNVDSSDRMEREPFTLDQLRKVLAVAGQEWRTMILVGLYGGLRLRDVANLSWSNVDLTRREITVSTMKTGRVVILPIAAPLLRHIESLPAGDNPRAPLCPGLAGKRDSWLSNQFFELMASAGLVQSRKIHTKRKAGRGARRDLSTLSFHSLRHTATSLLKNAGVSDVVARDIVGHESVAVSRNYTHVDADTKRRAMDTMPDVTK